VYESFHLITKQQNYKQWQRGHDMALQPKTNHNIK